MDARVEVLCVVDEPFDVTNEVLAASGVVCASEVLV